MPEANPATGAPTIENAVATGLFGGMEPAKQTPAKEPEKEPEQEAQSEPEGQPNEEPAPEPESDAGDESPADDTEQDDQAEPEEASAPKALDLTAEGERPITLKIDGKDVTMPLKEAAKGFQLYQAFQAKTSELAEQRKAHEAERTGWTTERQQHADVLKRIHLDMQQAIVGAPPDVGMLDPANQKYDPNAYLLQKAQFEDRARHFTARLQYLDQVEQQGAAQTAEQRKQQAVQAREKLKELIPEFGDPEKAKAITAEVRNDLKAYGFSDKEIQSIGDPRMVKYLVDSMRSRKAKAGIESKKVTIAPKPALKPGAAKSPSEAKSGPLTAAKAQLVKNRDLNAGAAFFSALRK
jgi:hypothetical protein